MELAYLYRRQRDAPRIRLPLYIRFTFNLLFGITITVVIVMVVARARGSTCPDGTAVSRYCAYDTSGTFSSIYLHMSGNDTDEINFTVSANTLMVGDLEVLWGRPEIRRYCETIVASWPGAHVITILPARQTEGVSRFTPILRIFFTRSGPPRSVRFLMHEARRGCR
jgi:hypothetical protein